MGKIEVGKKCKQIKALNEFNFNYVGSEFRIVSYKDSLIICENSALRFGISDDVFFDYFELVEPKVSSGLEMKGNIKVIRNGRATIVILPDGCKGVSKCLPDDRYDAEKGYQIAVTKAYIKSLQKQLKALSK